MKHIYIHIHTLKRIQNIFRRENEFLEFSLRENVPWSRASPMFRLLRRSQRGALESAAPRPAMRILWSFLRLVLVLLVLFKLFSLFWNLLSFATICNDTVGISEHGQATSGILFNFGVSSGGISSGVHHHVQDYKRSSSWNIDHGFVET